MFKQIIENPNKYKSYCLSIPHSNADHPRMSLRNQIS